MCRLRLVIWSFLGISFILVSDDDLDLGIVVRANGFLKGWLNGSNDALDLRSQVTLALGLIILLCELRSIGLNWCWCRRKLFLKLSYIFGSDDELR